MSDEHSQGIRAPAGTSAEIATTQKLSDGRNAAKSRIRTSIACRTCRTRRSKCLFEPGDAECQMCRRSNIACVVENTDGRRRRRSKDDMKSLRDRLTALESIMQDKTRQSDPIIPCSCHSSNAETQQAERDGQSITTSNSPRSSSLSGRAEGTDSTGSSNEMPMSRSPPRPVNDMEIAMETTKKTNPTRLPLNRVCTSGSEATPTTPHGEINVDAIYQLIASPVQEYLLDLFWTNYSPILPFVNKDLYLESKSDCKPRYYSVGLECCLFLVGLRFADSSFPGVPLLQSMQSRLYHAVKRLVEADLDEQKCLTTVQALLLLGDVEASLGKFNLGSMHVGEAYRVALHLGLDLDCNYIGLLPSEAAMSLWTLFMCLIFDRYWALVFERCPTIKNVDLKLLSCCAQVFENPETLPQDDPVPSAIGSSSFLREVIASSDALRNLGFTRHSHTEYNDYYKAIALGTELHALYKSLSDRALWHSANIRISDSSVFLLHQHFYVDLILLYRPFAHFQHLSLLDDLSQVSVIFDKPADNRDQACQLSRMICFTHAITLTNIIKQHHARINGRNMMFQAVGHAEIAASTLLLCVVHTKDVKKKTKALSCLASLMEVLRALAQAHRIAERTLESLTRALQQCNEENSTGAEYPDTHCGASSQSTDVAPCKMSATHQADPGMSALNPPEDQLEAAVQAQSSSIDALPTNLFTTSAIMADISAPHPGMFTQGQLNSLPPSGDINWPSQFTSGHTSGPSTAGSPFRMEESPDFTLDLEPFLFQPPFLSPLPMVGSLIAEGGSYAARF